MDISTWITYVILISALIAFPGPSSLLITLHGYQYGVRKTNYSIFGNLIGSLVLMTLSALGLGVMFFASDLLFTFVKYLGAAYLIFLGIKTWNNQTLTENKSPTTSKLAKKHPKDLLKQGFFTGLSNPKDLIFFTALFPVFIDSQSPMLLQLIMLMTTWLIIDYTIKLVYAFTGKRINKKFTDSKFVTAFNRITGGMFIMAGITLANSNK